MRAPSIPPVNPRLDHIDGLRAAAALWVVSYHMWVRLLPSLAVRGSVDHAWWLALLGWCRYGRFAVDVFIVISGFCLALPVLRAGGLRGGAWAFWKKRARRILPTYYAAMIATLPLCWLFLDWSRWFVTTKGVLLHIVLLQDVFGSNEISSVYWSIAVEWHIYLLFPLLVLLIGRIGVARACLVGCVSGATLYLALKETPYIGSTPQYLMLFCFGILAARLCAGERTERSALWSVSAAVLVAGLVAACDTSLIERAQTALGDMAPLALDGYVGASAACVIVAAGRAGGWVARTLGAWPLARVGAFSYSLYLMHAPIHFLCLKTIWVLLQPRLPAAAACPIFVAISVPIILAGALAFYLLFEAPFLAPGAGGALEEYSSRLRSASPLLRGMDRLIAVRPPQPAMEPPALKKAA